MGRSEGILSLAGRGSEPRRARRSRSREGAGGAGWGGPGADWGACRSRALPGLLAMLAWPSEPVVPVKG